MNIYIVYQWSIRPDDQERCMEQLAKIAAHVERDHPDIVTSRTFIQSTGPLPRRGITWWEEWPSMTKLEKERGHLSLRRALEADRGDGSAGDLDVKHVARRPGIDAVR